MLLVVEARRVEFLLSITPSNVKFLNFQTPIARPLATTRSRQDHHADELVVLYKEVCGRFALDDIEF